MKFECRESKYPIEKQILSRVSSRAFSDEVLSDEELMTLFEAARWAPSSYNNQPWRFLYARKDDPEWARKLATLTRDIYEQEKELAKQALK